MLKKRSSSLKIQVVLMMVALIGVFWAMRSMKDPAATSGFMEVMMSGSAQSANPPPASVITQPAEVPQEPANSDTSVDNGR